ncbi:hypothetical protein GCM10010303_80220 [Streptomyces purpurascens]|nr:hypothetical protein GCM10010303_80220 [Streptomyces purpurascens]
MDCEVTQDPRRGRSFSADGRAPVRRPHRRSVRERRGVLSRRYQATQVINWASTTGGNGFGKKFNYFRGTVWVQKNDQNKCSATRSPRVNANESGTGTS